MADVEKEKEYAIACHDFVKAAKLRQCELQLHEQLHELEQQWITLRQEVRPVVSEQHIAEVVAMWTGIPVVQIATEEAECLLKLEDELHQRVIGQHEAVEAVARAVRRSRPMYEIVVVPSVPLRRTVQRMLDDMLAEMILQGTITAGNTVMVDGVDGKLIANTLVLAAETASAKNERQAA